MPIDRFIQKLERFAPLSDTEKRLIRNAIEEACDFDAAQDIVRRGESTRYVHLLLDGWAARYTDLPNGDRQITAYLLPGDLSDQHNKVVKEIDHSISALSPCRVASIRGTRLAELAGEHKNIATALQICSVIDEAISREWLVSLGRRSAPERIAHLICEMFVRLKAIGLAEGDSFEMPLTQVQLADMMGLSVVHMNRSLSKLRREGLIEYSGGRMTIENREGLIRRGGFDPLYLRQADADEKLLKAV